MKTLRTLLSVLLLTVTLLSASLAENTDVYYLTSHSDGSTVNAGKDTGYSKTTVIKEKDIHYGWDLGYFTLGGYTSCLDGGVFRSSL